MGSSEVATQRPIAGSGNLSPVANPETVDYIKTWKKVIGVASFIIVCFIALNVIYYTAIDNVVTDESCAFLSTGCGLYLLLVGYAISSVKKFKKEKAAEAEAKAEAQEKAEAERAPSFIAQNPSASPRGRVDALITLLEKRPATTPVVPTVTPSSELGITLVSPTTTPVGVLATTPATTPIVVFDPDLVEALDAQDLTKLIIAFAKSTEASTNPEVAKIRIKGALGKCTSGVRNTVLNNLRSLSNVNDVTWRVLLDKDMIRFGATPQEQADLMARAAITEKSLVANSLREYSTSVLSLYLAKCLSLGAAYDHSHAKLVFEVLPKSEQINFVTTSSGTKIDFLLKDDIYALVSEQHVEILVKGLRFDTTYQHMQKIKNLNDLQFAEYVNKISVDPSDPVLQNGVLKASFSRLYASYPALAKNWFEMSNLPKVEKDTILPQAKFNELLIHAYQAFLRARAVPVPKEVIAADQEKLFVAIRGQAIKGVFFDPDFLKQLLSVNLIGTNLAQFQKQAEMFNHCFGTLPLQAIFPAYNFAKQWANWYKKNKTTLPKYEVIKKMKVSEAKDSAIMNAMNLPLGPCRDAFRAELAILRK